MNVRRDDTKKQARFRTSRFFEASGAWYFQTREGSVEGPFSHRTEAERRLTTYLSIFKDLEFPHEFVPPVIQDSGRCFALQPIQMQWR